MPNPPQNIRRGLTWKRVKAAFRKIGSPSSILKNIQLNTFVESSKNEHIFVVGPPRSGTTLLMSILSSHSEIVSPKKETYFFLRWNYSDFEIDDVSEGKMEEIIRESKNYVDLFDRISEQLKVKYDGSVFLEKTPEHAVVLNLISKRYPKSKFVAIVRDPRDGYLSARRNPQLDDWSLENYCEDWRQCAVRIIESKSNERLSYVKYEELCKEPYVKCQKIMNHIGKKMEERQLKPEEYRSSTEMSEWEGHGRLNREISSKTVGQWREKLGKRKVDNIEKICSREMKKLGYL
jgi:hypothetical protein